MKKSIILPILISMVFLYSCSTENTSSNDDFNPESEIENFYFPPFQSAEWDAVTPTDLEWNLSAEDALYNFLEEKNSKAFIILKEGKLVVEWYFGEHTQNTSWYWASAGKTLTAFTVGLAQQQGLLDIEDKTSKYLGEGWTNVPLEKENLITPWHQLTMTSGMDDTEFDCVTHECLTYLEDAGARWAYHNGPYTLLQHVVANATNTAWSDFFNTNLRDKIGMDGFWFSTNGTNNVFFSTARSMARFGLLNLSNGEWDGETILRDVEYRTAMKNTSQELNMSYGYLWWLNGKQTYRAPGTQTEFQGELIPNAPSDLYAGLGKNDQKLYIIPSQDLVIVRMGEDAGEDLLGPSSFDNELWEKLNAFIN
ncbi:serine hydrolase domain-containing protein [Flagellimonas nanhaiensis]|uniref:Class C beta-lactamase-related serine hydrolase n=1 Tax=Flagellimonas nanhaiensis TaxID=2292706 RepID=A0A371JKZ8_9FLAO|nr:serine hydrolase [Allomuricauda nanhaiensis]RDY57644.1 class C beta-lactamase-related serine hydrolase [Allomuricauda nanhaiensis]